jgi:hypothetical protein
MQYYNYKEIFKLPNVGDQKEKGNQIFHFTTSNKSVEENLSTLKYIKANMNNAQIFESDASILKFAVESALPKQGFFLEFGVCSGRTINFIAALNPFCKVHGFDSFEGIPENWKPNCPKGTFALHDNVKLMPLLSNVDLLIGYFENTLPIFVQDNFTRSASISFIHMECDVYSSTKTVLKYLGPYIKSGTVIHFDEYFNYDGWENHEHLAFQEFILQYRLQYEYIAYNKVHEQVTVRIK